MNVKKPESISTDFIYRCLGFGENEPDRKTRDLTELCCRLVLEAAEPRAVYRICGMKIGKGEGKNAQILIEGSKLGFESDALALWLGGCSQCVLMAVTLGGSVDKLLRRTQLTDMAKAVIMDACASSLTEDVCDSINVDIAGELSKKGLGLTGRFSPGYGDLSLSAQDVFSELLDMNRQIGLSQSGEHLLTPRKSVTAVMGIGNRSDTDVDDIEKQETLKDDGKAACDLCLRKEDCAFRKSGGHCGRI